ncbi:MAG: hypothetical protein WD229_13215, partial [Pirellulales bacterium]
WYRGRLRLKRSFGTAVKIWGDSLWANFSTYAKLAILTLLALRDPIWIDVSPTGKQLHEVATTLLDQVWR